MPYLIKAIVMTRPAYLFGCLCLFVLTNALLSFSTPSTAAPVAGDASSAPVLRDCEECPEMVAMQGGTFLMGSPLGAPSMPSRSAEAPQHSVQIKAFSIGKIEVTQAQWHYIVGSDISAFKGRRLPVESISVDDVQEFLTKLSKKTGRNYRLPTEAEWEFAARCGNAAAYGFGDKAEDLVKYAWFDTNANEKTHEAASKLPNACGLYDMHGNVQEWTEDCWTNDYGNAPNDGRAVVTGLCSQRVVRGGTWYDPADKLRSGSRQPHGYALRSRFTGFRVVRDN